MGRAIAILALICLIVGCSGGGSGSGSPTTFEVTIENVAASGTLSGGGRPIPVVLSPGAFAVHSRPAPIFTEGQPARANGLESLAEDGDPSTLAQSLQFVDGVSLVGLVMTPVGQDSGGLLGPGQSYKLVIRAQPGASLSVALAFLQSNDLFLSPGSSGIALFDANGAPVSGDITGAFQLWDAGTEVNQQPGLGTDQPVNQAAPNTGPAEGGVVRPVADGFTYPAVPQILRVVITPQG